MGTPRTGRRAQAAPCTALNATSIVRLQTSEINRRKLRAGNPRIKIEPQSPLLPQKSLKPSPPRNPKERPSNPPPTP